MKKGNVFYSILKSWNDSESELKECENESKLKALFNELQKEKQKAQKCAVKRCFMCYKDRNKDFFSYMNS